MWLVDKIEIYISVDCKWFNMNAPWSLTHWSHSLLGSAHVAVSTTYRKRGMVDVAS